MLTQRSVVHRLAAVAAIVFLAASPQARPAEPASPAPAMEERQPPGSELQLFIENDMFAGTDRYYTNGIKFGVGARLATLRQFFKKPSKWMLDLLSNQDTDYHFGLFAGQNLYTPRNIKVHAAQPDDRPWAAWLYLGGVAQQVAKNRLDTVEIDLGVVGPPALGDQVQTEWHRLVGSPQPRGWDNQIPGEPAFLASYLQKRRFSAGSIELIPHAGVTLGTVMTLARAGGIVRAGRHMTGFGPDSIEPGGAMLQNTRHEYDQAVRAPFEWYGFVGADYRLVARNIFLDGTMFRDSPSVDHRTHVHDLSAGLSLRYKEVRFSLTRILRSEEFITPVGGGGKQSFYSLNVGLEF